MNTGLQRLLIADDGHQPIIDKLYNATAAILSKPEMKDMLARQMLTVMLSKSSQRMGVSFETPPLN